MIKNIWNATVKRIAVNLVIITASNVLCVTLAIGVSLWLGVLKFGADDDTGQVITAIKYVAEPETLPPAVGYATAPAPDSADFARRQRVLANMKNETLEMILLIRSSWIFSNAEIIHEAEKRRMLPPGIVNLEELEPIK